MTRKSFLIASILALFPVLSPGEGVRTKLISPDQVTTIVLSQNDVATIKFPRPITNVYCKGLVNPDPNAKVKEGLIQGERSVNKMLLNLTSLVSPLKARMNVYMGDKLYAFNLVTGPDPDLTLTLEDGEPEPEQDKPPVDDKLVRENRVNYDPKVLVALMDKARGAFLQRRVAPEAYKGYEHRNVNYPSFQTTVNTQVTDVHKFPEEDAIVLEGKVTNLTAFPKTVDKALIAVNDFQREATFWYCPKPIPPHGTETVVAELLGDVDGSRGTISPDQQYRIIIDEPTKEGGAK